MVVSIGGRGAVRLASVDGVTVLVVVCGLFLVLRIIRILENGLGEFPDSSEDHVYLVRLRLEYEAGGPITGR